VTLHDWKSDEITRVIFKELIARANLLKDELSMSAGKDPADDRFKVGYIQAINDFTKIEMADLE
jgi:hypothetical protein